MRKLIAIALFIVVNVCGVSPARVGFVVNVIESGGEVVATGSGTINTTDLMFEGVGGSRVAEFAPSSPIALFGPTSVSNAGFFGGISGPSSFGPGGGSLATSGAGDIVGIYYSDLLVPENYNSGSLLSSSGIWSDSTFSSLGLTTGTYTWNWGSGADADYFTMNIGTSAVPEPSSVVMLGLGTIGIIGAVIRRRRTA